jgi:hypothetical protein
MVELQTTNYKGRIGEIIETRIGYYKIQWVREADGSPIGHVSWVRKEDVKVII